MSHASLPTAESHHSLLRDASVPAIVAGFVTVLVGFSSSAVIVFQAAQALGADEAQIASWMWALGIGLAAITAAICTGPEAHENPARRYVASVAAGDFYILIGLFGATVAAVFAALRQELILAIAGIALLGAIGNGLVAALADESQREPALVTFLVTASGLTLAGVGSVFWGLVGGVLTMLVLNWRKRGG